MKLGIFKNEAGGLGYHLGALRSGRKHWSAFREALSQILFEWTTLAPASKKSLVLIGPSGGYCLNKDWVRQFEKVTVLEIDLLARLIFRLRFKRPDATYFNHDLLMQRDLSAWIEFLKTHDESTLLFCNILGQLPLSIPHWVPPADRERWGKQRVQDILGAIPKSQSWASFHDRISFQATSRSGSAIFSKAPMLSTAELCDIASRRWKIHAVCDHGTEGIAACSDSAFLGHELNAPKYLVWPLSPGQVHIIEWTARSAIPLFRPTT